MDLWMFFITKNNFYHKCRMNMRCFCRLLWDRTNFWGSQPLQSVLKLPYKTGKIWGKQDLFHILKTVYRLINPFTPHTQTKP